MYLYPVDELLREAWKTFPVRFPGPANSRCCSWPTILVQSMDGGFVTSNCWKCGNYDTLSQPDFLHKVSIWLACPKCGDLMYRSMVGNNYGFTCHDCDVAIRLADVLPRWQDLKPRVTTESL